MKKFAIELAGRFLSDNPKFFKVIQYVSLGTAFITWVPGKLAELGITLPPKALLFENKAVALAAVVTTIIAQLPKQDPPAIPPTAQATPTAPVGATLAVN